jgi:hypothetical protein
VLCYRVGLGCVNRWVLWYSGVWYYGGVVWVWVGFVVVVGLAGCLFGVCACFCLLVDLGEFGDGCVCECGGYPCEDEGGVYEPENVFGHLGVPVRCGLASFLVMLVTVGLSAQRVVGTPVTANIRVPASRVGSIGQYLLVDDLTADRVSSSP